MMKVRARMTANVKKIKVLSDEEIFKMEPEELLDYLVETFQVTIPVMITPENHLAASTELSKAAQYSKYLSTLKDRAEMRKIKAELDGNAKLKKEMLARQKVFEGCVKRMDKSYEAISRLFSIKNQEMRENHYLGNP